LYSSDKQTYFQLADSPKTIQRWLDKANVKGFLVWQLW